MTDNRRRVLVIAYHYPPLAGAGMLKILRTTRYLTKYNWDPLVLTVRNPEPYFRAPNPIPEKVEVCRALRIPGGNLLARVLRRLGLDERWLLLPDQYLFWIPGALFYGWFLVLSRKIDLIYATGPPYSALLVGRLLALLTRRPFVTDIRDPWSFNAARQGYPSPMHRLLDCIYERWVLKGAAYITCIYQITVDGYRRLYPELFSKMVVYYDSIDLEDLPKNRELNPVFTLTYLGTFYPPFRSLVATFRAIRYLLDSGVITPEHFCFQYVGPPDKTFEQLVAEFRLGEVVRSCGYKPLKQAQLEACHSQMLLLLLEFATINTKLFDYLASGNAILAVVPEFEELSEILERYADRYYKVTNYHYIQIAEFIKQCYNDYYQGLQPSLHPKQQLFLATLNIAAETRDLAALFDRLTDKKEHHD